MPPLVRKTNFTAFNLNLIFKSYKTDSTMFTVKSSMEQQKSGIIYFFPLYTLFNLCKYTSENLNSNFFKIIFSLKLYFMLSYLSNI